MITYTIWWQDLSDEVVRGSLKILEKATDSVNICRFDMLVNWTTGNKPLRWQKVLVVSDWSKIFNGFIEMTTEWELNKWDWLQYEVECIDYTKAMQHRLVVESFTGQTVKTIVDTLINDYIGTGFGITTTNVVTWPTIDSIQFNYLTVQRCLQKIAQNAQMEWYIDYEKDVHMFNRSDESAPESLTDSSDNFYNLTLEVDTSQLRNSVVVRWSTYPSNNFSQTIKADGTAREWLLARKPKAWVSLTVDWVYKDVGVDPLMEETADVVIDRVYSEESGSLVDRTTLFKREWWSCTFFSADDDYIYIGARNSWNTMVWDFATPASADVVMEIQYSSLTEWQWNNLVVFTDWTNWMTQDWTLTFIRPEDWGKGSQIDATTEIDPANTTNYYYLRIKRTANILVTAPAIAELLMDRIFEYMFNFQEKFVRCSAATTTPIAWILLVPTYRYEVPIIAKSQNNQSIEAMKAIEWWDGLYEHIIVDESITTKDEAKARAAAEIADYANPIVNGNFQTRTGLLQSGSKFVPWQILTISLNSRGLTGDYNIQEMTTTTADESEFYYDIRFGGRLLNVFNYFLNNISKEIVMKENEELLSIEVVDETVTITETITKATPETVIESVLITENASASTFTPPYTWWDDADEGRWGIFEWS